VHTSASIVFGAKELLNGSSTQPPVLNADSEATVVTGMANTSRATSERIGNFVEVTFYQFKISKVVLGDSTSSK
jgi:hypothetical protein